MTEPITAIDTDKTKYISEPSKAIDNSCTCGQTFLDAEDFRDHLPCTGNTEQQLKNALFDLVKKVNYALEHGLSQTELLASRDRAITLLANHNWWK